MSRRHSIHGLTCLALLAFPLRAENSAAKKKQIDSFELVWQTLRDNYWDVSMGGVDWQGAHDRYLKQVTAAKTKAEASEAMARMIGLLPSSHLAIIPGALYKHRGQATAPPAPKEASPAKPDQANDDDDDDTNLTGVTGITAAVVQGELAVRKVDADSGAAKAGVQPGWIIRSINGETVRRPEEWAGLPQESKDLFVAQIVSYWLSGAPGSHVKLSFEKANQEQAECDIARQDPGELTSFANILPQHVEIQHRKLASGVGYISLNMFLNPVKVMPEIEKAVAEFQGAPGIVLDVRDNPGGIAGMAMGIAGWFVDKPHERLGTMTTRAVEFKFSINPRLKNYPGKLAILVNGGSASTSEILAQGLHDLGRARTFGTPTAGAALLSLIMDLPDGDRFQYPSANYTSLKGRVLEAQGVQLDDRVDLTISGLLHGHDEQLDKAMNWILSK